MVYYFTSNTVSPSAHIYVGKDKVENEELIKYGWEEDFHADNLSSAHIYLRLPSSPSSSTNSASSTSPAPTASDTTTSTSTTTTTTTATASSTPAESYTWDSIPHDLLTDLAQLTKANSIEGNKKDNVTVIYTPWSNLRKDGSMAVGQVGFRDERKVKKILVPARTNAIINRLNKTRVERFPDLRAEREDRQREVRKREQATTQERRKEEARVARERKEKAWQRDHAYDDLFAEEEVMRSSNQDRGEDFLDDFM